MIILYGRDNSTLEKCYELMGWWCVYQMELIILVSQLIMIEGVGPGLCCLGTPFADTW